jgi:ATP-binding cassette, subfamily G (WHITE), member 2, PDR
MASPWAVVREAESVVANVQEAVQEDLAYKSHGEPPVKETPGDSVLDSSENGEKIHALAQALTEHSIKSQDVEHVNPFDRSDNPLLDPLSEKFSPRAWMKALIGVQSRDPARYPQRVAGVAYKNLSAHGFGDATDYQKTFSNYPLETGSLFKRLIGRRRQTKIQILRKFDGLVRSGEMLVVLGRPGR